jgi:protein-tyrosine phosphatase
MLQSSTKLTHLPLNFTGNIYRSPMPFSSNHDRSQTVFQAYKENDITLVVILASKMECLEKSGRDLRAFYEQEGLQVIEFPIQDYGIPDQKPLHELVDAIFTEAAKGRNIAIHCHAGIGRTGTVCACLARQALGLSPAKAITWVRALIPGAVETNEQREIVYQF